MFNQIFSQENSWTDLMLRNNLERKLSLYDINIEGSDPYVNEIFVNGKVVLDSINSSSGRLRIDAYALKLQTLNKSGQIFEILIDDNDYVKIGEMKYSFHKFENEELGDYGILRMYIS